MLMAEEGSPLFCHEHQPRGAVGAVSETEVKMFSGDSQCAMSHVPNLGPLVLL